MRSSKPLVWREDVVGVGEVGGHAVGLGVDTGGGVEAQTGQGVVGRDQIHRTQILLIKKCKTVLVVCCVLPHLGILMNVILSVIIAQVLFVSFVGVNVLIEIVREFLDIHCKRRESTGGE